MMRSTQARRPGKAESADVHQAIHRKTRRHWKEENPQSIQCRSCTRYNHCTECNTPTQYTIQYTIHTITLPNHQCNAQHDNAHHDDTAQHIHNTIHSTIRHTIHTPQGNERTLKATAQDTIQHTIQYTIHNAIQNTTQYTIQKQQNNYNVNKQKKQRTRSKPPANIPLFPYATTFKVL